MSCTFGGASQSCGAIRGHRRLRQSDRALSIFELRPPPLHLATREVLVAIVHRLELAAVDRHARRCQQAHLTAQIDEASANLADGLVIVLAKVGERLVIGYKAAREPHHLDVASGLALDVAARLDPIEIAIDVELQQHRRMIGRPTGRLGIDPAEPRSLRSSSSTKMSITRTELSSTIQSSRQSGNSVLCPRSTPSTKRFIRSPANRGESDRAGPRGRRIAFAVADRPPGVVLRA